MGDGLFTSGKSAKLSCCCALAPAARTTKQAVKQMIEIDRFIDLFLHSEFVLRKCRKNRGLCHSRLKTRSDLWSIRGLSGENWLSGHSFIGEARQYCGGLKMPMLIDVSDGIQLCPGIVDLFIRSTELQP